MFIPTEGELDLLIADCCRKTGALLNSSKRQRQDWRSSEAQVDGVDFEHK